MCLNIGTPKNIIFPFETNGKLMILGVPILKHFRVFVSFQSFNIYLNSMTLTTTIKVFLYFFLIMSPITTMETYLFCFFYFVYFKICAKFERVGRKILRN